MNEVDTLGYPLDSTIAYKFPELNVGYRLSLGFFDTFNSCVAKLNPHIKYLEQLTMNNDWVPVPYRNRFMSIKARWHVLARQEVPRATEMVCRKGHKSVKLLWKDLLQLREELEDMGMKRLVTFRTQEAARLERAEAEATQSEAQSQRSAGSEDSSDEGDTLDAESQHAPETIERAA